jgi:hypothetical protein
MALWRNFFAKKNEQLKCGNLGDRHQTKDILQAAVASKESAAEATLIIVNVLCAP